MPTIIEKDILTITSGILIHCTNCRGKMGAGIAKSIKIRWPIVYKKYMHAYYSGLWDLGKVQIVHIQDSLYVGNLAGQYNYGRNKQYVNYDSLRTCFKKINIWSLNNHIEVYIPYKIACSNAGGSWDVVFNMISVELPNSIICKIPNTSYQ